MHDDQPTTTQQVTGQMRSLFYLVDEPNTTLSLLVNGQAIITRAAGQIALDLRALPCGATICATLCDVPPYDPHIIAVILNLS